MTALLNWSVGITAAPRKQPQLTETLLSLRDAGWDCAMVSVDSEMIRGPWGNFRHLAQTLACGPDDPDAFLIVQDDVQLTRELRTYLEADDAFHDMIHCSAKKAPGAISLYCAAANYCEAAHERFQRNPADGGWHAISNVPTRAFGALAYVFTQSAILSLLEWRCPAARAPIDHNVGCFCRDSRLAYVTHSPSFVRHTGVTSAIPDLEGMPEFNIVYRQCKEFMEAAPKRS